MKNVVRNINSISCGIFTFEVKRVTLKVENWEKIKKKRILNLKVRGENN